LLASLLLEQILLLKGLLEISAFAPFNVDVEANLGYLFSRLDVLLSQNCLLFSNHFVHSYGAHAGVEHLAYLRSIISFFHPVFFLSIKGRNDFLARLFLIAQGQGVVVLTEAFGFISLRKMLLHQNWTQTFYIFEAV